MKPPGDHISADYPNGPGAYEVIGEELVPHYQYIWCANCWNSNKKKEHMKYSPEIIHGKFEHICHTCAHSVMTAVKYPTVVFKVKGKIT